MKDIYTIPICNILLRSLVPQMKTLGYKDTFYFLKSLDYIILLALQYLGLLQKLHQKHTL